MGITIKVLKYLEEHFGNNPDSRLQNTIELIAENSTGQMKNNLPIALLLGEKQQNICLYPDFTVSDCSTM